MTDETRQSPTEAVSHTTPTAALTDEQWPCELTPVGIKPCWALEEVLQPPYGRGTRSQGVVLQTLINMNTREFSRQLVILKSGQHSKKGMALNFCPFCAGEIIAEEVGEQLSNSQRPESG